MASRIAPILMANRRNAADAYAPYTTPPVGCCPGGKARQVGGDQVGDQAAGGLRRHHGELVGGGERGDAVHAGPQHAGSALALRFLAGREQRCHRLLDPPHQPLELLLIPRGKLGLGGHVMLEQQVPQPRLLMREGEVGLCQPSDPVARVAVRQHRRQTLVERVENAGLHMQHDVVQVLEHIVDGARRVFDAPGNFARGQAGKSLVLDNVLRGIENQLAQLLRRVRRPASHDVPWGGVPLPLVSVAASIGGNRPVRQLQPAIEASNCGRSFTGTYMQADGWGAAAPTSSAARCRPQKVGVGQGVLSGCCMLTWPLRGLR